MKRMVVPDLWSMYFQIFVPKVTWFHSGVSRVNLYCSFTNFLFSLTSKILFINSGFNYLLFHIFQYTNSHLFTLIFTFLLFLINLRKILSDRCIKFEALFLKTLNFIQGFNGRIYPNQRTIIKLCSC